MKKLEAIVAISCAVCPTLVISSCGESSNETDRGARDGSVEAPPPKDASVEDAHAIPDAALDITENDVVDATEAADGGDASDSGGAGDSDDAADVADTVDATDVGVDSGLTPCSVVEYAVPTAGSIPLEIALGPDGNVWFTEYAGNRIGRTTPTGQITEFVLPTANRSPAGIVAGPDGHLWVAEQGGAIGRVTTNGVIDEIALPSSASPRAIAVGPDTQLWFVEAGGASGSFGSLYRLALGADGGTQLSSFTGATAGGGWGITAGPDGNLWLLDGIGAVVTMTPSGGKAPVISLGSKEPRAIVMAPDGALWVTADPSTVMRIVKPPGGGSPTTTSFSTGGVNQLGGIANGPDGARWFVAGAPPAIGRIADDGTITLCGLAAGDLPSDIIAGADGKLWFTLWATDKIGVLTP